MAAVVPLGKVPLGAAVPALTAPLGTAAPVALRALLPMSVPLALKLCCVPVAPAAVIGIAVPASASLWVWASWIRLGPSVMT